MSYIKKVWHHHRLHHAGIEMVYIDRHLLHEVSSPFAFDDIDHAGVGILRPGLTHGFVDHMVSTSPNRTRTDLPPPQDTLVKALEDNCARWGIDFTSVDSPDQGIVHVVAPEKGMVLPGDTVVCGDSHTCTLGAMGAIAWGIGTSEVAQVLAVQALEEECPKVINVVLDGQMEKGATAKDVALAVVSRFPADAAKGYALEYTGSLVTDMTVEERFTLCNMTVETGARIGVVPPDATTWEYVQRRVDRDRCRERLQRISTLQPEADDFDETVHIHESFAPRVTWGTRPSQSIELGGVVPTSLNESRIDRSLQYMGLRGGERLGSLPVDVVFLGSCTNGRLEDFREAAAQLRGRRVAPSVRAWAVPGSRAVQRACEVEGIDRALTDAGFEWRAPGCSMCVSINGDLGAPGERIVSTSNRSFEGRQGPGTRTHLGSPRTAVEAAVLGFIPESLDPFIGDKIGDNV